MSDALERTATIAPSDAAALVAATRSERPTRIGRFLVEAEVGRGGMGIVYRATDPLLGRPVAVKLLAHGDGGTEGRVRLLREAQAIAQLQHPNVVAVHDVGEHEGQVYLAMEYLDARTLRAWQRDRPPREVLGAYLAAGRGLAAAHVAGLVHRDFKPDNVAVDAAGQVKLLDFGLARAAGRPDAGPADLAHEDAAAPPRSLEDALTLAGVVVGTPAYMAPEQLEGQPAGPAADQFAFCASLWEALTGQRPFAGRDLEALREAARRGPPVPGGRGWQRAVLAVAARGLAWDPAARHASLVDCLEAVREAAGDGRFDLEVGRGHRRLMLGLVVACGLGAEYGFVSGALPVPRRADELLPLGVMTLVAMAALTRLLWRALNATDVNRRIGLLTVGGAAMSLINRLVATRLDTPAAQVVAADLLIIATLGIGLATRQARWFATGAGVQIVAALTCAFLPEAAHHVFTVGALGTGALMAWFWER